MVEVFNQGMEVCGVNKIMEMEMWRSEKIKSVHVILVWGIKTKGKKEILVRKCLDCL